MGEGDEKLEAPGSFEDLEVAEAMTFDFFGTEGEEKSPAEVEEAKAKEVQEPEKAPEPTPEPKPTPAPEPVTEPEAEPPPIAAKPVEDPQIGLLKQANADWERRFNALQEHVLKQQAPPAQPQPAQPERVFNIGVPDELIAGMASEDPIQRRNATQVLVNGVGDMIYKRVMADVREYVPQTAQRVVESRQQEAQQNDHIQTDFYGKYPQWAAPELRIVVYSVANAVARELGATSWSPGLRDAIAARMATVLPASPQPPVAPDPREPRRSTPPTVRPGTRALPSNRTAVEEVLGIGEF